jgi:glycerol-1-phosphate dehydrogenase [NAD(P)+]
MLNIVQPCPDVITPEPAHHGEPCGVGNQYDDVSSWWRLGVHSCDTLKTIKGPVNADELGIEPEYIIKALTMAHTIRKEDYTILGDRGLTEEAAENLHVKTGVID